MLKKSIIKIVLITALLTSLFSTNANALSSQQEQACTVLLCLSASGGRPHECSAPIRKFLKDTLNPRKWWKTISNRKNFLKLCPTGSNENVNQAVAGLGENDPDLEEYANAVATINPDECTASYLNNHVDITLSKGLGFINKKQVSISELSKYQRIQSIKPITMNPACNSIYKSKYQELKKPTNICNTQQSYTFQEWNSGYIKKQISHKEYLSLDDNQRAKEEKQEQVSHIRYKRYRDYQKQMKNGMITKRCTSPGVDGDGNTCYYTFFYKLIPINKECWID